MSFLGSIGVMMSGSGLEEVLSEVYAKNVVPHIMSGKAYSRAMRGHFLVQSAVMTKLLRLNDNDSNDDCDSGEVSRDIEGSALEQAYNDVLCGEASPESISTLPELTDLEVKLEQLKDDLKTKSRMSRLWIQYIEYISVVKMFIRAERSGS